MSYLWLLPLLLLLSFTLTAALRKYALSRSIIDIPNARSSHSAPTPRGGGVAIVISFFLIFPILSIEGIVPLADLMAIGGAGIFIAIIGFMDDHGHIAARWRLLGHGVSAAWALFWINGLPPLSFFGVNIDFGWFGTICAAFYLVWMLNLYNFMDGIDGIASLEAVSSCLCMCILYWWSGHEYLIVLPACLIMSVAGFLLWNFPPAKIFMGDAGSGFLGIALGVLSLQAAWISTQLFWAWIILFGIFIVDATFTLVRRVIRKDKIYEAHRSHGYQFAARLYGKHYPVTVAVGLINIFWLFPVAISVVLFNFDGLTGVILAYLPLILLAVIFNSGALEASDGQAAK